MTKHIIPDFMSAAKVLIACFMFVWGSCNAISQTANPANWMYPDGNSEGTRYVKYRSGIQSIDSFKVKWSTPDISGDIKPLIGNVINNGKIFPGFSYAPNEIVAVRSGQIVVVDATGKTHGKTDFLPYLKDVSSLIDTTKYDMLTGSTSPLVMGIETVEMQSADSLSFAYIAGFHAEADTVRLLRRIALDMRPYSPNNYAAIKPIYGRKYDDYDEDTNDEFFMFGTVNTSSPTILEGSYNTLPYFRGLAQFRPGSMAPNYPLPDSKDVIENRVHLAGEVNFATPSITETGDGKMLLAMPYYPTTSLEDVIVESPNLTTTTRADVPYLTAMNISTMLVDESIMPTDLSYMVNGTRPQIRPYYVHIKDQYSGDSVFILVAEEYRGRDGSNGTSKLHLFNLAGDPITSTFDATIPPFVGGENHLWSVAVGNVDGYSTNTWDPFYPNNPGQEIIVTQSSRDFAVASSKLYILKYFSGAAVEKPTPPGAELFPFDTICSRRINGWVAAVNDIDNAPDGKDEIFLVDGSILRIMRLRDYNTFEFKMGNTLDTVASFEFKNQTISNVAIAELEGDGLNDIVVTTHDSTYVIGSEIYNTLQVLQPETYSEYCAGDSLEIKWVNVIKSPTSIEILYQGYIDGVPIDTLLPIHSEYENIVDTSSYIYVVGPEVLGTTGHFVVRSPVHPDREMDTTANVKFLEPWVSIDVPTDFDFYPGKLITISGSTLCVDSVMLEFSFNGSVWVYNVSEAVRDDGTFRIGGVELPCPDFFECDTIDGDRFLYARGIAFRAGLSDTSVTVPLPIHPAYFEAELVPCETGCPTRVFNWNIEDLPTSCDVVNIYISADQGNSFSEIASLPATIETFSWNVPIDLPDEIIVRFCCDNACLRTDTILKDYLPTYINVIAPNPFNPYNEKLEVTYTVPMETNVSIKIIDAADRLVAEPVRSVHRTAGVAFCDTWDGIRHDGTACENGLYYVVLELSNGYRQVYPLYIKK